MDQNARQTKYLNTAQAAERMRISRDSLRKKLQKGKFPGAYRDLKDGAWRIPEDSVISWVNANHPTRTKRQHEFSGPPYAWERFRNRPFVFYAGLVFSAILSLVTLMGFFSVVADIGPARHQLLEWNIIRSFPSEQKNETLIVIAHFYYPEGIPNTEAHEEIKRAINNVVGELGAKEIRVEVHPMRIEEDNKGQAEKLGKRYRASMVIWGSDTGVRVTVNFLDLKQKDFEANYIKFTQTKETQIADPSGYVHFITTDLPSRLTFLSLYSIGHAYFIRQDYDKSIELIEKAITSLTGTEENVEGLDDAYFRLGWIYGFVKGDLEIALNDFNRVIELNSTDPAVFINRGAIRGDLGDQEGAESDVKTALELTSGKFPAALNNMGLILAGRQDYRGAIEYYTKSLELEKDDALTLNNRGVAYFSIGDYENALEDFNQSLEIEPAFSMPICNIGLVYYALGKTDDAFAYINKALSMNDYDDHCFYNRGYIYKQQQRWDEAAEDFTRAIAINPRFEEAYVWRGLSFKHLEMYEEAAADFDQAIAINPNSYMAYNDRGLVRYLQGRYSEAIADYKKSIEIFPDFAWVYCNLGFAKKWIGDLHGGLQDLNKCLVMDNKFGEGYWERGIVNRMLNNKEEALNDWRRSLELDISAEDRKAIEGWIVDLENELKK